MLTILNNGDFVAVHIRRGDKEIEVPHITNENYVAKIQYGCPLEQCAKTILILSDDDEAAICIKQKLQTTDWSSAWTFRDLVAEVPLPNDFLLPMSNGFNAKT